MAKVLLTTAGAIAAFAAWWFSPYSCSGATGEGEALALSGQCPAVASALGTPVGRSWGFSNYSKDVGLQTSTTSVTVPVVGSHDSGRLDYTFVQRGPHSGFTELYVQLPSGRSVDVLECTNHKPGTELLTP